MLLLFFIYVWLAHYDELKDFLLSPILLVWLNMFNMYPLVSEFFSSAITIIKRGTLSNNGAKAINNLKKQALTNNNAEGTRMGTRGATHEELEQLIIILKQRSEILSRHSHIMKDQLSKIIQDALEHKPTVLM